jgi:hypothetical protein
MFKRFYSALANLSVNIEALAAALAEANERFRQNVLGDGSSEVPALEHTSEDDAEPATNERRRKVTRASWDPPWDMSHMSEEARLQLGLFD